MGDSCAHVCDEVTARAFRAAEWLEVIVRGNLRDPLPHIDIDWLFVAGMPVITFLSACDAHHRSTCPVQFPGAMEVA